MPTANYKVGETFRVQFAWKLPAGDYLRAVFEAQVLDTITSADKYIVRLNKLVAGRQEKAEGELRPLAEYSPEYWALVGQIAGNKLSLAYEADDGRALYLRLATLTGEHNYFRRFSDAEAFLDEQLNSAENAPPEVGL
jgi:hypothetical protein